MMSGFENQQGAYFLTGQRGELEETEILLLNGVCKNSLTLSPSTEAAV